MSSLSTPKPIFGVSKSWKQPASRIVLHVDMNSYFASVEQSHRPHLKGKPVLVLSDPYGKAKGVRSVVAAASYEAKAFGVKAGMPSFEALKLVPDAIMIGGDHHKYSTLSKQFLKIFERYTDLVEPYSIDEAFLDITRSMHLFGGALKVGGMIKADVSSEIGITCSVGIGPNKLVAKMASDLQKPDGLVKVEANEIKERLWGLMVEEIPGVGRKNKIKLNLMGIRSIEELAKSSPSLLRKRFGIIGDYFHSAAWGLDDGPVLPAEAENAPKSISRSITFSKNSRDLAVLKGVLLRLTDEVAVSLREKGLKAKTLSLVVRFSDLSFVQKQKRARHPTSSTKVIFSEAAILLQAFLPARLPIRLLGVCASEITKSGHFQPSLFDSLDERTLIYEVMDEIRDKFGSESLFYGRTLDIGDHLDHRI
ncbi:MAG: DNA polymerase IV [Actinomycetota bacterium]|nr:DNA polymerase IV [Actinomycetota bacterium]